MLERRYNVCKCQVLTVGSEINNDGISACFYNKLSVCTLSVGKSELLTWCSHTRFISFVGNVAPSASVGHWAFADQEQKVGGNVRKHLVYFQPTKIATGVNNGCKLHNGNTL